MEQLDLDKWTPITLQKTITFLEGPTIGGIFEQTEVHCPIYRGQTVAKL